MVVPNPRRDEFFQIDTMLKDLPGNIHKSLCVDCHILIIITIANILNIYNMLGTIISTLQELIIYLIYKQSMVCVSLFKMNLFY